jgi:hypothetical protein
LVSAEPLAFSVGADQFNVAVLVPVVVPEELLEAPLELLELLVFAPELELEPELLEPLELLELLVFAPELELEPELLEPLELEVLEPPELLELEVLEPLELLLLEVALATSMVAEAGLPNCACP